MFADDVSRIIGYCGSTKAYDVWITVQPEQVICITSRNHAGLVALFREINASSHCARKRFIMLADDSLLASEAKALPQCVES